MTVVFSDDNRVTWFVCAGGASKFCVEFVEKDLVTFQRSGRRDVVLARGVVPERVQDPESAKAAFEGCVERRWRSPESNESYLVESREEAGEGAYRVTSSAMVHVVIPGPPKPVGLLTDEELLELVRGAFGDSRGSAGAPGDALP